jgi:phage terminase large subunit
MKAYRDGYRVIANKGSARSSKTWSIIQCYYAIASDSPKHKKLSMVSQSFPHLRDGIVYDFEQMLANEGVAIDLFHGSARKEFRINKSVINYFSADNPGKVLGPARNILYLNEPNKGITFEVYQQLRTRTKECIFLDWNPSARFWLQKEGVLEDPRTKIIHSTWMDNIGNLSKEQIQDFLDAYLKSKTSSYWDYWWKVYGMGVDAVLMEERVMPFLHRASVIPPDAIEIPAGLDFGFNPDPTAFIRLFVRKRPLMNELYIKQVVYGTKLSINAQGEGVQNLCDILKERGVNPLGRIIAESADPRAINDMRAAGFSIEAVRKTSVEQSIRLFHDYKIFVVDGSDETFEEMDNYKFKRDKATNEILPVPEEKQKDHAIDAIRYVLLSKGMRWTV